jgi:hypothetical protein
MRNRQAALWILVFFAVSTVFCFIACESDEETDRPSRGEDWLEEGGEVPGGGASGGGGDDDSTGDDDNPDDDDDTVIDDDDDNDDDDTAL